MSSPTHDPHESDAMAGPHGADDHGEDHGHDDHAHGDGEPLGSEDLLGPLDPRAWGAGVLGIVGGLIVAAVLAVGAGWLG